LKFGDSHKLARLMQISSFRTNSDGGDVSVSFSSWDPGSHLPGLQRTAEFLLWPKTGITIPLDFSRRKSPYLLWICDLT